MPLKGLYSIEFDEYLKIPAVSNSQLGHLLRSPVYFDHYVIKGNTFKKTESMELGSRVHTLILEPESFYDRYVVIPDMDLRSKEGKEAKKMAEATAKQPVRHKEYDKASRIRDAVMGNEIIAPLLSGVMAERTGIFYENNFACKIRPDALNFKSKTIIDLKTTNSISEFQQSLASYGYYRQAAYYLDGMNKIQDIKFEKFIFVVVQTIEPYYAVAFELSQQAIDFGRLEYRAALKQLNGLEITKDYRDQLQKGITILDLPEWYYRKTSQIGEFNSKGEKYGL